MNEPNMHHGEQRKVLAIHQPDFIPYSGFFYKIDKCDRFLIADYLKFSKHGYNRRATIHGKWCNEAVIALSKSDKKLIRDIEVDVEETRRRLVDAVDNDLRRAPHYDKVMSLIDLVCFDKGLDNIAPLTKLNLAFITSICDLVGIDSSKIDTYSGVPIGKKADGIVEIMQKQYPGYTYLSGVGGANYITDEFDKAGIPLVYSLHEPLYSDSILTVIAYEPCPLDIIRRERRK
jgi:hypothetical protein|nr:MAG TPA: WbqC-like protein [Caudoviricetes sp.]